MAVEQTLININVEGQHVCTMRHVLMRSPESRLWMSIEKGALSGDRDAPFLVSNGTIFLDGDAELVRILINALRHPKMEPIVPENFDKWSALLAEAHYLGLLQIAQWIRQNAPQPNMITLAYHGTLPSGIQAFASDVNFRKISRILISGKVTTCRQVFGESLNETRDVAIEADDRYTSRFFLKHTSLERALDALAVNGFKFTSANSHSPSGAIEKICTDEQCYMHYTQFLFIRNPSLRT